MRKYPQQTQLAHEYHVAIKSPLFPPDLETRRVLEMTAPLSTALHISYTVRAAMEAPTRASISTPVLPEQEAEHHTSRQYRSSEVESFFEVCSSDLERETVEACSSDLEGKVVEACSSDLEGKVVEACSSDLEGKVEEA